jgi:HEAT repeat protein
MARNRIVRFVLFIAGVATVVSQIGCSFESIPANRERQKQAAREEYERNSHAEIAASDRRRAEEMQRRKADPGSLSIQESDAEIEALKSTSSIRRASAAEKLGDAKGPRAVEPLIADLQTERDPVAFTAVVQALKEIGDVRAIDALVEALSAPNMPDYARERALFAIVEFQAEWRFVPQIQRFYDSLTDKSVRGRTRLILQRYGKAEPQ